MNRYVRRFLNSKSAEALITLFNRAGRRAEKEISESWAMLEAVKRFSHPDLDTIVCVIGDGVTPRTGALLAYFTKCDVVSCDPNMDIEFVSSWSGRQLMLGQAVQRLTAYNYKAEEIAWATVFLSYMDQVIFVWPHSHADMNSIKLPRKYLRVDIAMPCCTKIPENWWVIPHTVYKDPNVLSPQNTIHIWTEHPEEVWTD